MPIATGIISTPITLIIHFVLFISSELGRLYFFAFEVSFCRYVSLPTFSTRNLPFPLEIKLPANSTSPTFFLTDTLSPVRSDSFTSTEPSASMQSAGT